MKTLNVELKQILSDSKKRRSWVLYQIHQQNRSLAELGRDHGVMSRSMMYEVFRRPYPKIEKILAGAVDLTPQQLFPERYNADGMSNRPMGRPKKINKPVPKRVNKSKNNCNVKDTEAD